MKLATNACAMTNFSIWVMWLQLANGCYSDRIAVARLLFWIKIMSSTLTVASLLQSEQQTVSAWRRRRYRNGSSAFATVACWASAVSCSVRTRSMTLCGITDFVSKYSLQLYIHVHVTFMPISFSNKKTNHLKSATIKKTLKEMVIERPTMSLLLSGECIRAL